MPFNLPHLIYGTFKDLNGNVIANAPLTITNTSTNNSQEVITNSLGQYLIDCGNFEDGYADNDTISIVFSPAYSVSDFKLFLSINGGNTWNQVENKTSLNMRYNQGRIKIDSNYAGIIDLTIQRGS